MNSGLAAKLSAIVVKAAHRVLAGGLYLSEKMAGHLLETIAGQRKPSGASLLERLTDRELEVLQRIVAGERVTDIAEALHLSVKTISTHKSRIQEKLQLPSMAALIRYGLEFQLDKADSGFGLATDLAVMPEAERPERKLT